MDFVSPQEGEQMAEYVRGAQLPAVDRIPVYDVVAPTDAGALDLTCLEGEILGVDTHWVIDAATKKGASRLCYRHQGDCPYCGQNRDQWLGWIACIDNKRRSRVVHRMAVQSARNLARLAVPHTGLLGLRVLARKPTDGRTAQTIYEASPVGPSYPLARAHDISRTVCTVLCCEALPDHRFTAAELIPTGSDEQGGVS